MNEQGVLTVRQLLKATYDNLAERQPNEEVALPEQTLAEIANDSDYHRTRIGYMRYESAKLFQFGDKTWAITIGKKYGSYPAEPYDSDLSALELSIENKTQEQIIEGLGKKIDRSIYFRNSLIHGMADGNLAAGTSHHWLNNPFQGRILELLKPKIKDYIAQKPEYDTTMLLASTLQHPTNKVMLYKPEFVDFLVDTIETVLKEQ